LHSADKISDSIKKKLMAAFEERAINAIASFYFYYSLEVKQG